MSKIGLLAFSAGRCAGVSAFGVSLSGSDSLALFWLSSGGGASASVELWLEVLWVSVTTSASSSSSKGFLDVLTAFVTFGVSYAEESLSVEFFPSGELLFVVSLHSEKLLVSLWSRSQLWSGWIILGLGPIFSFLLGVI